VTRSSTKLNLLDSASIDDALLYTTASANLSTLPKDTITHIDYFTIDDMKYADTWHEFGYEVHHLGFRFTELPKEVDIAVFGCSFTFGIGLPQEMLWHSLLQKKAINFGLPGASAKTALDLFLIVSKHIKIKQAIILLPSLDRMQIAKNNPNTNEVAHLSIIAGYQSKVAEHYSIDGTAIYKAVPDEERHKIFVEQTYLSEYVAKHRDIELYYSSWDSATYQVIRDMNFTHAKVLPEWISESPELIKSDLARDKLHPGPKHHQIWANKIKDLL
jgi:hypothetical protein